MFAHLTFSYEISPCVSSTFLVAKYCSRERGSQGNFLDAYVRDLGLVAAHALCSRFLCRAMFFKSGTFDRCREGQSVAEMLAFGCQTILGPGGMLVLRFSSRDTNYCF